MLRRGQDIPVLVRLNISQRVDSWQLTVDSWQSCSLTVTFMTILSPYEVLCFTKVWGQDSLFRTFKIYVMYLFLFIFARLLKMRAISWLLPLLWWAPDIVMVIFLQNQLPVVTKLSPGSWQIQQMTQNGPGPGGKFPWQSVVSL